MNYIFENWQHAKTKIMNLKLAAETEFSSNDKFLKLESQIGLSKDAILRMKSNLDSYKNDPFISIVAPVFFSSQNNFKDNELNELNNNDFTISKIDDFLYMKHAIMVGINLDWYDLLIKKNSYNYNEYWHKDLQNIRDDKYYWENDVFVQSFYSVTCQKYLLAETGFITEMPELPKWFWCFAYPKKFCWTPIERKLRAVSAVFIVKE